MPRKRKINKHLPPRVYWKNGAFRFLTKEGKWIRLGKSLSEALTAYAEHFERPLQNRTMRAVIDRYLMEILPQKAVSTTKTERYGLMKLKTFFGDMEPSTITPVDVYRYMDLRKKTSLIQANKEMSILSSVFLSAIRWGVVADNPCRNVKRFAEPTRDRYVEHEEFNAFYNYVSDSPIIQAVMLVDYFTAMRLGDVLFIKLPDLKPQGIEFVASKTKKKSIIEWSDDLIRAVELARSLLSHRVDSIYLFSKPNGQPYTADGFKSIWQRWMRKAIKAGVIKERFMIKDIRSKAATDAEDDNDIFFAQRLLQHSSPRTTERHYIRKVQKVAPTR